MATSFISKGYVNIPLELLASAKLQDGDEVEMELQNGAIVLKKLLPPEGQIFSLQQSIAETLTAPEAAG